MRYLPKAGESAQKLAAMHKSHGESVSHVLEQQFRKHAGAFFEGRLDESSMLALVAGQKHLSSLWRRFSDRIFELLSSGVPKACKSPHKPANEPHLQQICDGILTGHSNDLIREFPFLRWSSSSTKPDWSVESIFLWVELKYIRKKEDIRRITEEIAADITKYTDNERHILFVVYDPIHLITDKAEFSKQIHKRQNMLVHFIN